MAPRSRRISRSSRAGLTFSVSRIDRRHRQLLHHVRMGSQSPVYLSGVIEYLALEILELAGNYAKDNHKKRITPRHLLFAIGMDQELRQVFGKVTIPGAGILPSFITMFNSPTKASKAGKKAKPVTKPAAKTSRNKKPKKRTIKTVQPYDKKATTVPRPMPITPNYKILSEKSLFLGQKLTVVEGDILSVQCDAIVSPTNSSYFLGGMVGSALKNAGGADFQQEVEKLKKDKGMLMPGQATMSPAYNVNAQYVIHCNGPIYREPNSTSRLEKIIKACLSVADSDNLRTLAIPSVGSGRAGFPKLLAAETILNAISYYFTSVMMSSIKQIYFVLYDKDSIDAYVSKLAALDTTSQKP